MNGRDSGHEEHETPPPRTLLTQPSVTLHFDGLLFMTYNERRRLFQAGIHTQAENHELTVVVTTAAGPVWPKKKSDWDPTLATVKAVSPLWLYVDSGRGIRDDEFSAELYKPEDLKDEQSFGHILDFEGKLYRRPVALRPAPLAALNIPQGVFYSAVNTRAALKAFEQGKPSSSAAAVDDIMVSTLSAADIDSRSDAEVRRSIVLAKNDGVDEVFRLPLDEGIHYTVTVMNAPIRQHPGHVHSPEEHFLQFYELFPLRREEKVFLVEPAEAHPSFFSNPDSPPCVNGSGSLSRGLPTS